MIAFNFIFHLLHAILCFLLFDKYLFDLNILCLLFVIVTVGLPDIDHENSTFGGKFKIYKIFKLLGGHRGFTHSIIALALIIFLGYKMSIYFNNEQIFYGIFIGYSSHLIADMTTPMGIKLLWPCPKRIKIPLLSLSKKISAIFWILLFVYLLLK